MSAHANGDIVIYDVKYSQVAIAKVTIDNMTNLEKMCNGSIKGTSLPPEQREIEFYCRLTDGEMRARVGDYLMIMGAKDFVTIDEERLEMYYTKAK